MVKAGANYYNYNLSTGQWQVVSTGTTPALATTTTAGIAEVATINEYKDSVLPDPYKPLIVEPWMSVFDHYNQPTLNNNDVFSLGLDSNATKGKITYTDLKTNLNASLGFAKAH